MKMSWTTKTSRCFTLLEIVICVALLSLVGSLIGWQAKEMVTTHHFHKNIDMLCTDLRKLQIMALSHRTDFSLYLSSDQKGMHYAISCDEPIPHFHKRTVDLLGIKEIKLEGKTRQNLIFHVAPNGRITPNQKVELILDAKRKMGLDLATITPKKL